MSTTITNAWPTSNGKFVTEKDLEVKLDAEDKIFTGFVNHEDMRESPGLQIYVHYTNGVLDYYEYCNDRKLVTDISSKKVNYTIDSYYWLNVVVSVDSIRFYITFHDDTEVYNGFDWTVTRTKNDVVGKKTVGESIESHNAGGLTNSAKRALIVPPSADAEEYQAADAKRTGEALELRLPLTKTLVHGGDKYFIFGSKETAGLQITQDIESGKITSFMVSVNNNGDAIGFGYKDEDGNFTKINIDQVISDKDLNTLCTACGISLTKPDGRTNKTRAEKLLELFSISNNNLLQIINNIIGYQTYQKKVYNVGDIVEHSGTIYKCKTAITTAEDWTEAHWEKVDINSLKLSKSDVSAPTSYTDFKNGKAADEGYVEKALSEKRDMTDLSYTKREVVPSDTFDFTPVKEALYSKYGERKYASSVSWRGGSDYVVLVRLDSSGAGMPIGWSEQVYSTSELAAAATQITIVASPDYPEIEGIVLKKEKVVTEEDNLALVSQLSGITEKDIAYFLKYKGEVENEETYELGSVVVKSGKFYEQTGMTECVGWTSDEYWTLIYTKDSGKTGLEKLIKLFGSDNKYLNAQLSGITAQDIDNFLKIKGFINEENLSVKNCKIGDIWRVFNEIPDGICGYWECIAEAESSNIGDSNWKHIYRLYEPTGNIPQAPEGLEKLFDLYKKYSVIYLEYDGTNIKYNGEVITSFSKILSFVRTGRVILQATATPSLTSSLTLFRPQLNNNNAILFDATGEINGVIRTRNINIKRNGTDGIDIVSGGLKTLALNDIVGYDSYSNTKTYAIGDIVQYNGIIYKCIKNITAGKEWTQTDWQKTSLQESLVHNDSQYTTVKTYATLGAEHANRTGNPHGTTSEDVGAVSIAKKFSFSTSSGNYNLIIIGKYADGNAIGFHDDKQVKVTYVAFPPGSHTWYIGSSFDESSMCVADEEGGAIRYEDGELTTYESSNVADYLTYNAFNKIMSAIEDHFDNADTTLYGDV